MTDVVRVLQVLYVVAWLVPLILFSRQAWRKANSNCDRLAAATWYTSFSIMCFPLFWLTQSAGVVQGIPHDKLAMWSALYVLGICAAVYLTLAVHAVCSSRD